MVAVLFLSLTAMVFSHYRDTAIEQRVDEVIGDAMPSIHHLTNTRGYLRSLSSYLVEYVESVEQQQRMPRSQAMAYWHKTEGELALYGTLRTSAVESRLFEGVASGMSRLKDLIGLTLDKADAGDHQAAAAAVRDVLHQADIIDDSLRSLVEFNARKGQQLGLAILKIRRSAMTINTLCIALAIVGLGLAVSSLRRILAQLEQEGRDQERRATEMAERAEELSQFAGRVAHDILGPIGGAQLALQLIELREDLQPETRDIVLRGLSSVSRVDQTVKGLLAFARAGARPEPGAHSDLRPVVMGIVDELRDEAREARIEISVQPFQPVLIGCSPGVLTSLVANPLRNSLRYMGDVKERRVTVRVQDLGASVRLEVEDTGPGISAGMEHRVFEPYVRASSAHPGGIGLGLSTVKRLAEAHGGRVGLHSTPGKGCRVWFEIPKAHIKGKNSAQPG